MCVVASVAERPFLFLHRTIIRERKKSLGMQLVGVGLGRRGRESRRAERSMQSGWCHFRDQKEVRE